MTWILSPLYFKTHVLAICLSVCFVPHNAPVSYIAGSDIMSQYAISLADVEDAHETIRSYVHVTPVMTSASVNKLAGDKEVFFKVEGFQKAGSFKVCTHSLAAAHSLSTQTQFWFYIRIQWCRVEEPRMLS